MPTTCQNIPGGVTMSGLLAAESAAGGVGSELAPWSSVVRILSSWNSNLSNCCFACAVLAMRLG